ncbi:MAG: murein biosynthesis integral membrane protein MurJ [Microbacteriaceae bacterium]|nr:murein biosynthesis integral membrane protein MurJ [Microbacteriaceae bacterium]
MTERSLRSSSLILGSGTLVSRALGFARAILLAQALGVTASAGADAFAVANQLPNNIYAIVAGGVFSATLVPAIVKSAVHDDGGRAYVNKLLTAALTLMVATTAVATVLAPVLVSLYASGWSANQLALATAFAYICLPQIFFYGLYALLGEILNGRKIFGPFTWAPVANNIIAIAGLVSFVLLFGFDSLGARSVVDWSPEMIWLLAGTATLGVATQSVLLFFFWRRIGLSFRLDFRWRGVGMRDTGRMASWTFGMLLLTQVAGLIETNVSALASGYGASVFTLQTAWLTFMLPHSIITVSLATAYFTRMSAHASANNLSALADDTQESVRRITLFMFWAMGALISAAFPFSTLFASGNLAVSQLAWVIIATTVGLPAFSVLFLLQRVFYALGDGRTPFIVTLCQTIVFSGLVIACALLPKEILAVGVATTLSVVGIGQTGLAFYFVRKRLADFVFRPILITTLRAFFAGSVSMLAGLCVAALLGSFSGGFAVANAGTGLLSTAVIGVVVTGVFVAVLRLVRTPELRDLLPRRRPTGE